VQSDDPFAVSIRLAVDHWQPLSLMDFMIVPKRYFPGGGDEDELEAFNRTPVGTGPYRLLDRDSERVRFQANPFYRKAADGLPRIREISFNSMDPVKAFDDFQQGKIHLIYGVPREQVVQLEQTGKKVVALPARSVYFLAPNYRKETILKLPEVRLAIANAINRTQILDTVFRPGQHRDRCAELNGPYPVGSWAYNPDAPKYNTAQAKVQLRSVQQQVAASGPLRLVHPERDPDAVRACQEIAVQVEKELGVKLTLEGVEPNVFYDQIVRQHNFDLVYWRHDFDDESYWIWPLFDPNDKDAGGANFMGIDPEANLRTVLFDTAKQHKDFTRVRELARLAHAEIARSAAIIPLWQLNTHVAVSPLLREAVFDPVYLFEDVEQWRLESGGRSSR
jgi:ABC-type transport system substrate-binding protein